MRQRISFPQRWTMPFFTLKTWGWRKSLRPTSIVSFRSAGMLAVHFESRGSDSYADRHRDWVKAEAHCRCPAHAVR